jgi:hypothetical protein
MSFKCFDMPWVGRTWLEHGIGERSVFVHDY